ncbi:MAG: PorV/PorQ family protein, partial [Endomicrobiales bacterium]
TAHGEDVSASYFNPALLASLAQGAFTASHFLLFDGSRYNFMALGYPVTSGYLAFTAAQLRSGAIEARRHIEEEASPVHAANYVFGVSLARRLPLLGLDAGVNLKYFSLDYAQYNAAAFGVDAGLYKSLRMPALLKMPWHWAWGLQLRNLYASPVRFIQDEDRYPLSVVLGTALRFPVVTRFSPKKQDYNFDRLVLSGDLEYNTDDTRYALRPGLEYGYRNTFFARLGYRGNLTFGLGYRAEGFQLDYALDPKPLAAMHRFGLSFYWGEPREPEESAEFARYRAIRFKAGRLYREQVQEGENFLEQGEYARAGELFKYAAFLVPEDNTAARLRDETQVLLDRELLKDSGDEINEKLLAKEHDKAYALVLDRLIFTDNEVYRRDAAEKAEKIYVDCLRENAALVPSLDALKKSYAGRIEFEIIKALTDDEIARARAQLLKLRLLDPASPSTREKAALVEEAKNDLVAEASVAVTADLRHKKYEEGYFLALEMLALDPANKMLQSLRDAAKKGIAAQRALSGSDLLSADEMYYRAAVALAAGELGNARASVEELMKFFPAHEQGRKLFLLMEEEGL